MAINNNDNKTHCCYKILHTYVYIHTHTHTRTHACMGLLWWLSGKESACQCRRTRDVGLIPGLRRCPGGENGNALQYSCLKNSMDRGSWQATDQIVRHESTTTQTYNTHMCIHIYIWEYMDKNTYSNTVRTKIQQQPKLSSVKEWLHEL